MATETCQRFWALDDVKKQVLSIVLENEENKSEFGKQAEGMHFGKDELEDLTKCVQIWATAKANVDGISCVGRRRVK